MILTELEVLENLGDANQLMRLTFDGGKDTAYVIWDHADLLEYLNDEVVATFRKDMYQGVPCKFINTLASLRTVHTLERTERTKLFTDTIDNHSTVRFEDIEDGTTTQGATVYIADIRYDSSSRANWADLTIMDQRRRVATLRLFSPDSKCADLKGRYALCDIRRSKYGLSTESLVTVDSSFPYNPEVTIAQNYILNLFADTPDILRLLDATRFIEFAKQVLDPEPGFLLVRLALELDIAQELSNLASEIDSHLLCLCLLVEKLRILQKDSPFNDDIVGFYVANGQTFEHKSDVLKVLYSSTEAHEGARRILLQVREMANAIVELKKGRL